MKITLKSLILRIFKKLPIFGEKIQKLEILNNFCRKKSILARKFKYHTKEINTKYFWRENSNTIEKKSMQNIFGAKIQIFKNLPRNFHIEKKIWSENSKANFLMRYFR